VLGTQVSRAKTDEPIEMPFAGWLLRTCRNMNEIELHIGATLQARLNDPCELSRVYSRRTQLNTFSKGSVHTESRRSELNWPLHQVDPVTRRTIGHARQRHEADWLQSCSARNCSSVQFVCCEHGFTVTRRVCSFTTWWNPAAKLGRFVLGRFSTPVFQLMFANWRSLI